MTRLFTEVQVQVVDGTAVVKQLGTDEGNDLPDLDLLSFVRVENAKQRAKQLNLGRGKSDTQFSTQKIVFFSSGSPNNGSITRLPEFHYHESWPKPAEFSLRKKY